MRLLFAVISAGCLGFAALCLPGAAQNVTASPQTGVTPNALLLYRADLLPGKEAVYEQTEAEIVQGYANAKIPMYWSALQSVTGQPHVLYFDGFDSFADIDKSGTDIAQGLEAHPEIATLQQKLADLVSSSRTVLAFRRDDLGYRLNEIDLAKSQYVRVSILQLRPGYEEEFAEAMRTRARMYETNDIDTPWMTYQVHSGYSLPTFLEFQPMRSLGEIDDALDRTKKGRRTSGDARQGTSQKWMRDADVNINIEIYRVSQSMSHLAALSVAGGRTKQARASTASLY